MDNFMPHGFCLQWNPQLVGLIVVSNLLTALSYYSIPSNLLFIATKKKVKFGWLLVLFALFIVLCGTTHIMNIVTIWNGNYWLEAIVNAMTAGVSLITAVALWILVPQVFNALETDAGKRVTQAENSKTRIQMITSLVLGMLAMVIVGGLLYQQSLGLIESRTGSNHNQEIVTNAFELQSSLNATESLQRGYLLTGSDASRVLFEKQNVLVLANLDNLSKVSQDDSRLKEQCDKLRDEVKSKLVDLSSVAKLRANEGSNAISSVLNDSHDLNSLDQIRVSVRKIIDRETQLLNSSNTELNDRTKTFLFTFVVLAILALGLFCAFGYFMSKYLTDVESANNAVRKSEELLRFTFKSLKDFAIINLDTAGKIIGWNSAAQHVHGYIDSEIIGQHFSTLYNEPCPQIERPVVDSEYDEKLSVQENERWQVRKDGSKFWAEVALSPIFDEHKNWTGFVQVTRDITERRKAQEEIKEQAKQLSALAQKLVTSNQDLQQFAYVASHDLQEPLRTITSFCELLEKKTKGKLDVDSLKYLNVIVEGTARMQRLIKDLLQCAKIDTQGKPLMPTDLSNVLEQSLSGLKVAIGEADAEITHDKLPVVLGDESQLSLLFQNLIGNAIKFRGKQQPKIHISVEPEGDRWQLSVKDNGIGIDLEYAEKIFVIFQRLHSRNKYEGSGIGLAVCKRIVERHGGTIGVKSVPGEGSRFMFTLQGGNKGD